MAQNDPVLTETRDHVQKAILSLGRAVIFEEGNWKNFPADYKGELRNCLAQLVIIRDLMDD